MQYSVGRYKALLENSDFRIDAEYFKPECLSVHEKINNLNHDLFSNKIKNISSGKNLPQTDIGTFRFIRTQNVRPILIDDDGMSYTNNLCGLKPTQEGELLFVRVGEGVGNSSIVTKHYSQSAISDNVLRLVLKNINPYFCSVFFNTTMGQTYFKRVFKGTARSLISQENFKGILIPVFTDGFQNKIETIVKQAQDFLESSKVIYSQAEQILIAELGFLKWKPKHRLSFIKKFSDTQSADRIDAEYFQPVYEEIEKKIKAYAKGFDLVRNQFKQNKKTFKTILDKEYEYVEISCVNTADGSIDPLRLKGYELPANAKIKLFNDDIIVSKVRPYRGAIGIVNSDSLVGSGAFTVLQENGDIYKETLMVFLRSKPMLAYSLKFNTGTTYPTITDDDILRFSVPLFEPKKQGRIKSKVEESMEMKLVSRKMLDIAKRGVEMAIEKNEKDAEEWMKKETQTLSINVREN